MKNTKIMMTILMIWALALIINLNAATAEEKSMVFEMAESGQTVSFPMTAEEIAAAEAEIEKPAFRRNADAEKKRTPVIIHEVGEGGHRIIFPLTRTDTAAEDLSNRQPDSSAAAKTGKPKCQVLAFEMAESGLLIEFPAAVKVIVVGDEDTIASREGY